MGLDIELYQCDNLQDTLQREDEYLKQFDLVWSAYKGVDYDLIPEEFKKECRIKTIRIAESLRLDEFGSCLDKHKVELPSLHYPDHGFKIGYFRSSYNSNGLDAVLKELGLSTLDWIFDYKKDVYYHSPNWIASLDRIDYLLRQYDDIMKTSSGQYQAIEIDVLDNMNDIPTNRRQALTAFIEDMKENKTNQFNDYANYRGTFYRNGHKCYGLMKGKSQYSLKPCIYAIMKRIEDKSKGDWYRQALEIVRETILYVFPKHNASTYFLKWNG